MMNTKLSRMSNAAKQRRVSLFYNSRFCILGAAMTLALSASAVTPQVADAMRTPALKDVRLGGFPAKKMNALFDRRLTSEFAREEIFTEARGAYRDRDDDWWGIGGSWKGEFWGKQMLSAARVADYRNDPSFTQFIREECHRLMRYQDENGYLGSYRDPDLITVRDAAELIKRCGCAQLWNLWNRKYVIWGMYMAYRHTGDKAILDSVVRQMDFWIDQVHRLGSKPRETGSINGLPSMSVLKPLLMLYAETGKPSYLAYAREIVADWDRADGACPNLIANAFRDVPLYTWYPTPEGWAKSYEMMSCLDGLLEYYRVTGDRRCFEAVRRIRENLDRTERNPFFSVSFGDKFVGATKYVNGLNELCDVIHWIRLNVDLFLITGEDKYMDAVELAYLNAFLPGICRDGSWGPMFIRALGRHQYLHQLGYAYHHCCVNNLPRTYMDVASTVVTRDKAGDYHVNLYQDATVSLDGVRFEISGNYPVDNQVVVRTSKPVALHFRKPSWCPKMDVRRVGCVHTLTLDMNPRLLERPIVEEGQNRRDSKIFAYKRYPEHWLAELNTDVRGQYRTTPAAEVMWGPLVLARARRLGTPAADVINPETVYGKGYTLSVTPLPRETAAECGVWGLWQVRLAKPGCKTVDVRAADFGSATDTPYAEPGDMFSIWF